MAPGYGYDKDGAIVLIEGDVAPEEVVAQKQEEAREKQHHYGYDEDGRLVKLADADPEEALTDKQLAKALKKAKAADAAAGGKKAGGKKNASATFAGGEETPPATPAAEDEGDGDGASAEEV